jgi:hypothetical protein
LCNRVELLHKNLSLKIIFNASLLDCLWGGSMNRMKFYRISTSICEA